MEPADERALLHQGGKGGSWGSLGCWPPTGESDYAGACRALARAVGQAAGLAAGSRVLSVACGAGDELLLWREAFGAAAIVGVECDASLVERARRLCAATPGISVLQGSGLRLADIAAPGSFDAVVCVDAAYHLRPRVDFLRGACALLRPGGRLAYTDLLIDNAPSHPWWRQAVLRGAARACGLRADDLAAPAAQLQRLRSAGLVDVSLQRLDAAVLDGYTRHVQMQTQRHGFSMLRTAAWRRPALTARLIGPCRAAGLGYALMAATRPLAGTAAVPTAATSPSMRSATA